MKSINTVILSVIHHHQNPLESIVNSCLPGIQASRILMQLAKLFMKLLQKQSCDAPAIWCLFLPSHPLAALFVLFPHTDVTTVEASEICDRVTLYMKVFTDQSATSSRKTPTQELKQDKKCCVYCAFGFCYRFSHSTCRHHSAYMPDSQEFPVLLLFISFCMKTFF
jgi:hypothetical protein